MSRDKRYITLVIIAALIFGFCGCSGDTDGGKAGDEDFGDTTFVPNDDNSGSIEVEVLEPVIPVSEISGFFVRVRDANGAPVPQIRVSCDSELGVAIIEPTTGSEITDSGGAMSGKIGCSLPGSFQFVCRLPIGANKRKFVDIKCTGDVPNGFDGFPGSAGGGLGSGGVQVPDEGGSPGGENSGDVRITAVSVLDNPGSNAEGSQIDIAQDVCTPDDLSTPANELVVEPFTDTFIKIKVVNNSSSTIRFTRVTYSVPNFDNTGRTFESSNISLIGETTVEAEGGEVDIQSLIFSVTGTGGDKFFVNASSGNRPIGSIGFRNVSFTLSGTNSSGETVQATGTVVLSFTNYGRCQ